MTVCVPGSAGIQEEASCSASEDARWFCENADGGRQSHSSTADDYSL